MTLERVVVTGLGVVSCVGNDVKTFWASLTDGRSGIGPVTRFDEPRLAVQIAGEVRNFEFDKKAAKRLDRFAQFAFSSSVQALNQAGIAANGREGAGDVGGGDVGGSMVDPARVGVAIGSGIGGETFLEAQYKKFMERGPGKVHPLTVPLIIPNMAAANVGIHFGFTGPNMCISTACATGNHNIGAALDMIRLGRADVMVAGGTEAVISAFSMDGYSQIKALSTRPVAPEKASTPFSADRDGFVLAEGAGVLVLEGLTHAKARGAEILAEVAGYGVNEDAHHLTAPHPEGKGASNAMDLALKDARLEPEAVDYVNAHGTSTLLNDAQETEAVKRVFGDHARSLAVSSIKSMVGHSLGGAAGLEAVACVLALYHGVIPPTINLERPDPALDLDYVPHTAREVVLKAAISNSFAFGGHNAVVAFRAFNGS